MALYLLIAAVVVLGVGLAVWGNLKKQAMGSSRIEPPAEIYLGLREKMLSTTPAEMNTSANGDAAVAYGVIMDLGMDSGAATIVSLSSGDTSMYTSRGGGIIGGIGHEACRNASKRFIAVAQSLVQEMKKAPDHSLPISGMARFYVLTTAGVLVCEDHIDSLGRGRSSLSPLFAAGDEVITQIRLTAPGYPDSKR
jgi:hypothetical protein